MFEWYLPFGDRNGELYFSAYGGNNMSVGKRSTDEDAVAVTLVLTLRRRLRTR
jgi:hypothetical protein